MASARSFRRIRLHAQHLAPPTASHPRRRLAPSRRAAMAGVAALATMALALPLGPAGRASASVPNGDGLVLNAPIVNVALRPGGGGYWEVGADGGIFAFGAAHFYGSTGSVHLNKPIVGVEPTPDGGGYWEVASDGGVFAFGDAVFHGSTGSDQLNDPVTAIEPTPDGGGYWIVATDGGVFSFGDAGFYGSATGRSPDSPIVGLATTPDGRGYWEAASDGTVFAFGDATFAGNAAVGHPVVGISGGGSGYRLASDDGGIDDFAGARFYGSNAGVPLNRPVIGLASTRSGYVTVASDGGIFAFGGVGFYGSLGGSTVAARPGWTAGAVSDGITAYQRAAWSRVNMCEEGGAWNVDGSLYSGGLGFSRANWNQFNTFGFPADAADATPDQQIRVAVAFATRYWGNPNAAPDQSGCSGGY
jgi:hypothetical protein